MSTLICYTDGGANPNPGYYGAGVHGYIFEEDIDKPIYIKGWAITNIGYYNKREVVMDEATMTLVKPTQYIDAVIPLGNNGTNNQAELVGVIEAIKLAIQYDVKSLCIYTDSDITCKGVNEWLPMWKKTNFVKRDGVEVSNKLLWLELDLLITKIKGVVEFKISWIKAHDGHLGNEKADELATIAINYSMAGTLERVIKLSDITKYWNPTIVRNPFFSHRRLYFNSRGDNASKGTYYLADNDAEDTLIGKRKPEASYSVIRLSEPDATIGLLLNKQAMVTDSSGYNGIFMVKLESLFNKNVCRPLALYKGLIFNTFRQSYNLMFANKSPMTIELKPVLLSLRAIDNFNLLEERLDAYLTISNSDSDRGNVGSEYMEIQDITDTFYTDANKLKGSLDSSVKHIKIGVRFKSVSYKITICLGIDLPNRNALKKLEGKDTTLKLVMVSSSDSNFTYCIIVNNDTGVGLFSNYFADRVFIKRV